MPAARYLPAIVAAAGLFAQAPDCTAKIEKPEYPQQARNSGVQGLVQARFEIGVDGRTTGLSATGDKQLAAAVESAIAKTQFGPACAGKQELVFSFVLTNEPGPNKGAVEMQTPPNFVVTSKRPGMLCGMVPRDSWVGRLFSRRK